MINALILVVAFIYSAYSLVRVIKHYAPYTTVMHSCFKEKLEEAYMQAINDRKLFTFPDIKDGTLNPFIYIQIMCAYGIFDNAHVVANRLLELTPKVDGVSAADVYKKYINLLFRGTLNKEYFNRFNYSKINEFILYVTIGGILLGGFYYFNLNFGDNIILVALLFCIAFGLVLYFTSTFRKNFDLDGFWNVVYYNALMESKLKFVDMENLYKTLDLDEERHRNGEDKKYSCLYTMKAIMDIGLEHYYGYGYEPLAKIVMLLVNIKYLCDTYPKRLCRTHGMHPSMYYYIQAYNECLQEVDKNNPRESINALPLKVRYCEPKCDLQEFEKKLCKFDNGEQFDIDDYFINPRMPKGHPFNKTFDKCFYTTAEDFVKDANPDCKEEYIHQMIESIPVEEIQKMDIMEGKEYTINRYISLYTIKGILGLAIFSTTAFFMLLVVLVVILDSYGIVI